MAGFVICTPKGNNPRAYFRLQPGSMDKYDFVALLKDMKKELRGKKLLLIWDGLPAHKVKIVKEKFNLCDFFLSDFLEFFLPSHFSSFLFRLPSRDKPLLQNY